ncbi:MAG: histidine kinase N-terminal 7TM domain-containing protein [Candidatus Marinimicrobia bacterium]|nr:histidine kinase N-terminal 7TM domain-containing protein [Candidatus Neomarinimicrobiota bacterium]
MYFNPYTIPLILLVLINSLMIVSIYPKKQTQGVTYFMYLVKAITIYTLFYIFEISTSTLTLKVLFYTLEYIGIVFIPPLFLLFALDYSGKLKNVSRTIKTGVFLIPILTLIIVFTNDQHHIFYRVGQLEANKLFTFFNIVPAPWYWIHQIYTIFLFILTVIIIGRMWYYAAPVFKKQITLILSGALFPFVIYAIYISGIFPKGLDPIPFAFFISIGLIYLGLFFYKVFDIVPLARNMLFDKIPNAVIVVDKENRLVERNVSADALLGLTPESIGQPLKNVLKGWPELWNAKSVYQSFDVSKREENKQKHYKVMINPIHDTQNIYIGLMVLFQDITDEKNLLEKNLEINQSLEERTNRLQAILKTLHDMITW